MDFDSLVKLEQSFKDVKFFSKNHTYQINNMPAAGSVTGLLKKFETPFKRDEIAQKVASKKGVSIETILEDWDYKRDYSSHKGSEFHLFAENYIQRKQETVDRKMLENFLQDKNKNLNESEKYYQEIALLIKNFLNFYDWWKEKYILIKSEFVVGDHQTKICGTIDNLSYNIEKKQLELFDYKTNKSIDKTNTYGNKMLNPFDYLPQCSHVTYSLQLWIYKLILERNTPFTVGDLHITWVGGEKQYENIKVLNLKKEAEKFLEIGPGKR
jgi:ATP-dependent exoDNAse (exonuclease V) beta subunit